MVFQFITCVKKTKLNDVLDDSYCPLGLVFVGFEIYEFAHYVSEGVTPQIGSYWSSFFILLGTHGAHVSLGIGWIICLLIQVATRGLNKYNALNYSL